MCASPLKDQRHVRLFTHGTSTIADAQINYGQTTASLPRMTAAHRTRPLRLHSGRRMNVRRDIGILPRAAGSVHVRGHGVIVLVDVLRLGGVDIAAAGTGAVVMHRSGLLVGVAIYVMVCGGGAPNAVVLAVGTVAVSRRLSTVPVLLRHDDRDRAPRARARAIGRLLDRYIDLHAGVKLEAGRHACMAKTGRITRAKTMRACRGMLQAALLANDRLTRLSGAVPEVQTRQLPSSLLKQDLHAYHIERLHALRSPCCASSRAGAIPRPEPGDRTHECSRRQMGNFMRAEARCWPRRGQLTSSHCMTAPPPPSVLCMAQAQLAHSSDVDARRSFGRAGIVRKESWPLQSQW